MVCLKPFSFAVGSVKSVMSSEPKCQPNKELSKLLWTFDSLRDQGKMSARLETVRELQRAPVTVTFLAHTDTTISGRIWRVLSVPRMWS